jgi:hypothetical protein
MTTIELERLLESINSDPTDRLVFLAIADVLEEMGETQQSQAWRLIAKSNREPMAPNEHIGKVWLWRYGCVCNPAQVLLGSHCDEVGTRSHVISNYIIGKLITHAKSDVVDGIYSDRSWFHPDWSINPWQARIITFLSRKEAFTYMAKKIIIHGVKA